jgi:hypothetical protein
MAWCLVKHRDNFTFYQLCNFIDNIKNHKLQYLLFIRVVADEKSKFTEMKLSKETAGRILITTVSGSLFNDVVQTTEAQ